LTLQPGAWNLADVAASRRILLVRLASPSIMVPRRHDEWQPNRTLNRRIIRQCRSRLCITLQLKHSEKETGGSPVQRDPPAITY